ncbi:putative Diguanylate cyclase with PAS/PAC sensor [Vibrio nigripulchritudo SFn27]|uniref:diguanylate cyclase n=1 Tax=Vibrio nigripulchritudo TaxID=28173 RepID=U4K557_9VIBR|nr:MULTISPECIES: sensor domain-containing diguanylate cyclase [Vibrio]UAB73810.1 sensor domain-containing diguanylate cyclase [Vibrio sp. SCSIO 43132]CCN80855.1 putative Diguanylate cyclase with PAS/PAC sensor [Vibrio nigripulchritudo BLFn1]CCN88028.1 putative Diguanylate cyclase with PAS/PAC sensor [Vibrio nigripulchritudo SFn27]CCN96883.1 putative Diguanylate cyclase with PAS/PAC sensor [Vibrio nigripulchritudo ENn2]CCO43464.1 putative Diguanylate cyclase with PAS/PAC sensor [Vibrio nigripul
MYSNIYKTALNTMPDGVLITDSNRGVIYSNARFAQMWGIPSKLIDSKDDDRMLQFVLGKLEEPEVFLREVNRLYNSDEASQDLLKFNDGRTFMRRSAPYEDKRVGKGRIWIFSDVSKLLELDQIAYVDSLTGLNNRRMLDEMSQTLFEKYQESKATSCIVLFDLDGFKYINDTYGHQMGDKLLHLLAKAIEKTLRSDDIAFRHGGDEFCLVLKDTRTESVDGVMSRLYETFNSIQKETLNLPEAISFSGGCVCFISEDSSPRDALARADVLLYQAKKKGKGQIIYGSCVRAAS